MTADTLVLDPAIRDWVVLPMVVIVILVGICRHYVQMLLRPNMELEIKDIRLQQTIIRSQRLRMNGQYINSDAYNMRKLFFIKKKTGILREKVPGPKNPMQDPTAMMDAMKGNMVFMISNFVMMGFVSSFFAGFVLVQLPFPLPSNRFKVMLQRGVDLSTLDVSYVSSLCWYFLVAFALNGVYQLLLGDESAGMSDAKMMQMQMSMGQSQGFDASAGYNNEKAMLDLTKHEWVADKAERELLGDRYPGGGIDLLDMSRLKGDRDQPKSTKGPKKIE